MASADEIRAELQRRRLRRELETRRAATPAATPATPPVGAPTDVPAAPQTGPVPPGGQFPVTVGKAAMPESVNKVMEDRGMDYGSRADALIGKAVADIGHGIKQLTVGLDEGDEADVQAWRDLSAGASMGEGEGMVNAGTVGDVSGAVAAFALPLGAAEQAAAKTMTALPKWASKVGAAMGVGGAEGFAQPVLEGDSRAVNTAVGAALPGALSVAGQTGRKVLTQPFKQSKASQTLYDEEGVMTTLGQGVDDSGFAPFAKLAKNVEENLEGLLPGVHGGRQRAQQEVVDALAKRAVPAGSPPTTHAPGSQEYFIESDKIFDDAYKEILDGMERVDVMQMAVAVRQALENNGMMVNPGTKRSMEKTLYGILEPHAAAGMTGANARAFQSRIRKQLSKLASAENANENTIGGVEILTSINDSLSDIFEAKLGTEAAQALRQVDDAYANKMLIETASGFTRGGEDIAAKHLDRAVRQRTGRGRRVRGRGQGQDIVDPAMETMGGSKAPLWRRALSGAGATIGATAAPAIAAIPLTTAAVGSTRRGARAMFGLYEPQRQMKKAMEEIVEPKIGTATALIHSNED